MLKKKFQLVGGSEGSGELKNKLLNKCWKKKIKLFGGSEGSSK